MALTFLGVSDFKITGPQQWRLSAWDLDSLVVPYSGPIDALDDFLSDLVKGTPHEDDPNMFLFEWNVSDTHKQYPAVDIIYQGKKGGVLPPVKHSKTGDLTSATTNTDAAIFPATVTNPATVEFYAITNEITVISRTDSTTSEPADPPEITSLEDWNLGFGLQPGFSFPDLVTYLLETAFVQAITEPPPTVDELIPGQYYKITKRKTRKLFPYAPAS